MFYTNHMSYNATFHFINLLAYIISMHLSLTMWRRESSNNKRISRASLISNISHKILCGTVCFIPTYIWLIGTPLNNNILYYTQHETKIMFFFSFSLYFENKLHIGAHHNSYSHIYF